MVLCKRCNRPTVNAGLKVCDFCLKSELEVSPIRLTGDDDGLMVCVDCETKYNKSLESDQQDRFAHVKAFIYRRPSVAAQFRRYIFGGTKE